MVARKISHSNGTLLIVTYNYCNGNLLICRKVNNFTMALFGYLYAFLQTKSYGAGIVDASIDFAYRQLFFGALQELRAFNSSKIKENDAPYEQIYQIFGNNFEKIYEEFKDYLEKENYPNVYELLKNISNNPCSYNRIVQNGTLIRYGRVCQVGDILHFAIKLDLFSRMYSGSIFEALKICLIKDILHFTNKFDLFKGMWIGINL